MSLSFKAEHFCPVAVSLVDVINQFDGSSPMMKRLEVITRSGAAHHVQRGISLLLLAPLWCRTAFSAYGSTAFPPGKTRFSGDRLHYRPVFLEQEGH
jgi:hypothetical protein